MDPTNRNTDHNAKSFEDDKAVIKRRLDNRERAENEIGKIQEEITRGTNQCDREQTYGNQSFSIDTETQAGQ
jgi:hypothetical protein